jgi:hypothetical protein
MACLKHPLRLHSLKPTSINRVREAKSQKRHRPGLQWKRRSKLAQCRLSLPGDGQAESLTAVYARIRQDRWPQLLGASPATVPLLRVVGIPCHRLPLLSILLRDTTFCAPLSHSAICWPTMAQSSNQYIFVCADGWNGSKGVEIHVAGWPPS